MQNVDEIILAMFLSCIFPFFAYSVCAKLLWAQLVLDHLLAEHPDMKGFLSCHLNPNLTENKMSDNTVFL